MAYIYGILWNIAAFWIQLVKENVQRSPKSHKSLEFIGHLRILKGHSGSFWDDFDTKSASSKTFVKG